MVTFDVAGVVLMRGRNAILSDTDVPVWAVAVVFAIAVYIVVDISTEREKISLNVAELPLVFALFFLTPLATVGAMVGGATVTMVLSWRQRGVKLVFNIAQFAMQ